MRFLFLRILVVICLFACFFFYNAAFEKIPDSTAAFEGSIILKDTTNITFTTKFKYGHDFKLEIEDSLCKSDFRPKFQLIKNKKFLFWDTSERINLSSDKIFSAETGEEFTLKIMHSNKSCTNLKAYLIIDVTGGGPSKDLYLRHEFKPLKEKIFYVTIAINIFLSAILIFLILKARLKK